MGGNLLPNLSTRKLEVVCKACQGAVAVTTSECTLNVSNVFEISLLRFRSNGVALLCVETGRGNCSVLSSGTFESGLF